MKNKNETAADSKSIRYAGKTVGETIDILAEAFSAEGDFHGLFILEQALEQAKGMRSQQQRLDEADVIFAEIKEDRSRRELLQAEIESSLHLS
tara:strand:+ start:298 stop:576 length:279 start_codon:yes stop_codon:yes gene_type:complete